MVDLLPDSLNGIVDTFVFSFQGKTNHITFRETQSTDDVGALNSPRVARGLPMEIDIGEFTEGPHKVFPPPQVARLHAITSNHTRNANSLPLPGGVANLGFGGNEDNFTSERKSLHLRLIDFVSHAVRTPVGINFPI